MIPEGAAAGRVRCSARLGDGRRRDDRPPAEIIAAPADAEPFGDGAEQLELGRVQPGIEEDG